MASGWRTELLKMYEQAGMISDRQCRYLSSLSNDDAGNALKQLSQEADLSEIGRTTFQKPLKRKDRFMEKQQNNLHQQSEQQKPYRSEYNAIREAVSNGWIKPLAKDDWKKLTHDDAQKIIQQFKQEHQNDDPAQLKPTMAQYHALADAVANGEIEEIPEDVWKNLNKKSAGEMIAEFRSKRQPELATESQKKMITQLVKEGHAYPMSTENFHTLDKQHASQIIYAGMQNKAKGVQVEGFDPSYQPKGQQPMTQTQRDEIQRLVNAKRLNPVNPEKLNSYTQSEAGKLIFVGRNREEQNISAPELEHDYTRRPPVPTRSQETTPIRKEQQNKTVSKGMEH